MRATQYFLVEPGHFWLNPFELWKRPEEQFQITFDWSRVLKGADTIQSVQWDAPSSWTEPQAATVDTTGTKASRWVGGGQSGTMESVGCTITTAGGRIYAARVIAHVREDA